MSMQAGSSYRAHYPQYPKEVYRRPQTSHGTMKREGILPQQPRANVSIRPLKVNTSFQRDTRKKVEAVLVTNPLPESIDGTRWQQPPSAVNDAKTVRNSRANCSLTTVAFILGKTAGQISESPHFFSDYFCSGDSLNHTFQVCGMIKYVKDQHIKVCGHNIEVNESGEIAPKKYLDALEVIKEFPHNTRFILGVTGKSAHGSRVSHFLAAQKGREGIEFMDYQVNISEALSGQISSSESSRRGSSSGLGTGDNDAKDSVDDKGIKRDRPYAVYYKNQTRYLVSPETMIFIACAPN